ncbi:HAD-IA family hydrolase [Vibrio hangzhouensis]|uniref:HAD-IA family hydrolase n=1 Tax=Vibrio hangzhouensis TaxID=462991 RepID=UPI0028F3F13F|nr:HAD-IA family hydrolase [Vibrio hangzhouensis]
MIFDCDGTLLDSERLCLQAIVDVLAEVGIDVDYNALKNKFQGVQLERIFEAQVTDSTQLANGGLDNLITRYRARCRMLFTEHLLPIDGVYQVLEQLTIQGIAICIASNAPHEKMDFTLPLTKLDGYFEGRVFSALDANAWKPDPKLLHYVMDKMQVTAEECVFIDDSIVGIQAGVDAKVTTLYFSPCDPHKPTDIDSPYLHYVDDIRQVFDFVSS